MVIDLLDGFLRGTSRAETAVLPRATFLFTENVRSSEKLRFRSPNSGGKIFLGLVGADVKDVLDPYGDVLERFATGGHAVGIRDDRHIVTVAGSRAGKGRAVLLPNLVHYPGSMLVIDPKGDLARLTAEHRRSRLGQDVHVLDPFGASRLGWPPSSYNPLDILRPDSNTLIEDAGLIADALVVPSGGSTGVHWDDWARLVIELLVLHVATAAKYEGSRDLLMVSELSHQVLTDTVKEELLANQHAGGAVFLGAMNFYDLYSEERSSVLSTVRRHLHFLGYQQMRPVLKSGGAIDLADLKRRLTTIYLVLPAMRMGTCSRWLRLIVNLTLAQMETVPEVPEHAVLLCLDEFAVLGTMKTIEDAAGQIAGLGVKLWPILQDLGQLRALYRDRWETFLGNAGVLQFFGNSDMFTLEWISKRLGQTTVVNESQSDPALRVRRESGSMGESASEAVCSLMTAEELSRFFGRDDYLLRQLVIRPTFLPMVLQRAFYDKHELFDVGMNWTR